MMAFGLALPRERMIFSLNKGHAIIHNTPYYTRKLWNHVVFKHRDQLINQRIHGSRCVSIRGTTLIFTNRKGIVEKPSICWVSCFLGSLLSDFMRVGRS